MDGKHKKILHTMRMPIKEELDLNDEFIAYLVQRNVLTDSMVKEIKVCLSH